MEDWLYYALSITFCLALTFLFSSLRPVTGKTNTPSLPPGPCALTFLGPLLFLGRSNFDLEPMLRRLRSRYGPIFTLYLLPFRPVIFICDHAVAHHALVQCGPMLADRPPANLPSRIFSSNQHNITSGAYGPLWRTLRRNLTANLLHPSRLRRFATARRRALSGLLADLRHQMRGNKDGSTVVIIESLQRAMFHVLIDMCFGEGHDEGRITAIEALQREFLTSAISFQVFGVYPSVTKLVFRQRWKKLLSVKRRQEELFIPLIRARSEQCGGGGGEKLAYSYVDSLLGLQIPEDGGRNLTESEMVSLCSELLTASTDSTAAVIQWIMANLVTQPEIQGKLRKEIEDGISENAEHEVQEDDLQKMAYLKAVVLEGLRRHPPGHFVLPHAVTEEMMLDGFRIPRGASVNFTVAEMALDEAVWMHAMKFRPERFLPGGDRERVDLTGSKEIKMMPFGAGRRICPGLALSMLHLEYFVANLVREFEWHEVEGEAVDFTEKQELSVVMRHPLRARIVQCRRNVNWS